MATENQESEKKRPSRLSAAVQNGPPRSILIEVGPTKKPYHVLEIFLTHYSEYFRKALSGPWQEGVDGRIVLEEVEVTTFNLFVEWLFTQNLPGPGRENAQEWKEVAKAPSCEKASMLRFKLYAFADRFFVPLLRMRLNRQIIRHPSITFLSTSKVYSFEIVNFAFQNFSAKDPILEFLVDTYVMFWYIRLSENIEEQAYALSQLPAGFLVRFMSKLGKHRGLNKNLVDGDFHLDVCRYHEHGSESERKEQCGQESVLAGPRKKRPGPKKEMQIQINRA